ncbi:ExbD/TolR family protein [Methylomicrobium lacus]|uniref:ExbD/TolR family protein n=1 Tax=Methylomicrobium lacus TaxID=136992 RepID=UPI00045E83B5|nr:biopolymer transporter ExbD [Methylomicrobium lacus]
MNFHRKKRRKIDITLISMIDVLFVLLLFFMVSTTFNRQTQVKIRLPEASAAEAEAPPKSITLVIDADGLYYVKGADGMLHQLVDQKPETLLRELQKMATTGTDLPFIISADGKTPHQAVISALDAAGRAGFTHITFEAQQPKSAP